jgi:hypothetical protein
MNSLARVMKAENHHSWLQQHFQTQYHLTQAYPDESDWTR